MMAAMRDMNLVAFSIMPIAGAKVDFRYGEVPEWKGAGLQPR